MSTRVQYVAELAYYDPDAASAGTLRYATTGFVTGPAETPANTLYDERLVEPGDVRRSVLNVGDRSTRVSLTFGEVTLLNDDGGVDALSGYAFDGRTLTIRRGTVGAAYPSGYTTVYVGTMGDVEVTERTARVTIRDEKFALETPLQTTKYDGDNVLPDGLEGVAGDLKGKPKPKLYGVAKNIPAPCVNTAKLIYQVNDGAIEELDSVFDRGINLVSTYFEAQSSGFSTTTVNHVYHGGGLYVASGDAGKIGTSPDGETWTQRTSNFAGAACVGGCYGNGRWLVVGGVGATSSALSVSTDGVTWTRNAAAETAFGAQQMVGATYSERLGLYVIVGGDGNIITSPDTVTWTARGALSGFPFLAVVDGEGLLVAGGGGVIYTSPDGVTWTATTTGGQASEITHSREHGFVAVFNSSSDVQVSRDGLTWKTATGVLSGSPQGALYGDGVFVAAGNQIKVAFDPAQPWIEPDNDGGMTGAGRMVAHGPQGFVVVGTLGFIALAKTRRDDYTSEADLLDDTLAPRHGQFGVYPAGGLFRLGSPPAGLITADVTQGATAANRTAGQLFTAVLTDAGYTASDWTAADITALDVADNSECGIWIGTEEVTVASVLDRIAETVGAWWGVGADGKYRIVQLTAPSGTADATFTANDILALERQPVARPSYSTILRYARHYVTQTSDVAFGVTDARRAELAKEWREAASTDTAVQTAHLLAVQTVEDSLYATAADALAEATRRQTLRGIKRHRYEMTVRLDATTEALDLGDVVSVTHPRFGLSGGVLMRVLGLDPERGRDTLRLTLWK